MDWYSWLSKTNLDPCLVYEYGRTFTHNELQRSDTSYFNHEFLQSMGVSVAKHRLEILKLARKNLGSSTHPKNRFAKLVSTLVKTKTLLSKKFGRCVPSKCAVHTPRPDANPFRPQWPSSNLRKKMGFDEGSVEEHVKEKMKSGPLDRRVYMSPKTGLSVSGPLERKVQEDYMVMYRSPMVCRTGPVGSVVVDVRDSPRIGIPYEHMVRTGGEVDVVSSLWSLMFQNMKPT